MALNKVFLNKSERNDYIVIGVIIVMMIMITYGFYLIWRVL